MSFIVRRVIFYLVAASSMRQPVSKRARPWETGGGPHPSSILAQHGGLTSHDSNSAQHPRNRPSGSKAPRSPPA